MFAAPSDRPVQGEIKFGSIHIDEVYRCLVKVSSQNLLGDLTASLHYFAHLCLEVFREMSLQSGLNSCCKLVHYLVKREANRDFHTTRVNTEDSDALALQFFR